MKHEWFNARKEFPPLNGGDNSESINVLLFDVKGRCYVGWFNYEHNEWQSNVCIYPNGLPKIKYWRLLPELPK